VKQLLAIFALLLSSLPAAAQNNAAAQANAIRPGDNLVLENIPAIPASIAENAFRYSEVRAASLEDWDRSRREMLIITRFADVPQVHVVKMPGGARTQLTFFPIAWPERTTVPRGATTLPSSRTWAEANGSSFIAMTWPTAT